MFNKLVNWFDYHIVYRAFNWRFSKKFAENPKMRQAFCQYMIDWGNTHEEQVAEKRKANIKIVK